jgi:hypothetical protein
MSLPDNALLHRLYDAGDLKMTKLGLATHNEMRIMVCSFYQNVATLVMNYTSQVLNGGHQQWIDNEYAEDEGQDLLKVLRFIDGEHCRRVINLVEQATRLYKRDDIDYDDEEDWGAVDRALSPLDTEFYSFNDEFCVEIENWLDKQLELNEKAQPVSV